MKTILLSLVLLSFFPLARAQETVADASAVKRRYSLFFAALRGVNGVGTMNCERPASGNRCVRVGVSSEDEIVAIKNVLRVSPLVLDGVEVIFVKESSPVTF